MLRAKERWNNSFSLRTEVEQARHRLALPENQFRPLRINEWHGIEEKIYRTFCKLETPTGRFIWLWERFKLEMNANWSSDYPPDVLDKLVDNEETVWLMLNDNRFWFYEGHIKAIQAVLEDSAWIDEVYVISKKYEWLLCINHHKVLYATGGSMPARLRQLEASGQLAASI